MDVRAGTRPQPARLQRGRVRPARRDLASFARAGVSLARRRAEDNRAGQPEGPVIRAAFAIDDDASFHRGYRELARHYGFRIDPTPPRSPEKKGKVEASVKYVQRNFLAGRDGEPIDSCNRELQRRIVQIPGQRIHGSIGKRLLEVFKAEDRAALLPLPLSRYEPTTWKQASVHRDSHVVFEKRQYSIPGN